MLPYWILEKNKKPEKFIQEQLYIEDYVPAKPPENNAKETTKKEDRGVVVIDLLSDEDAK